VVSSPTHIAEGVESQSVGVRVRENESICHGNYTAIRWSIPFYGAGGIGGEIDFADAVGGQATATPPRRSTALPQPPVLPMQPAALRTTESPWSVPM
jgi:hypothetical protein